MRGFSQGVSQVRVPGGRHAQSALQYPYATSAHAAKVKLIRLGAAERLTENAIRVLGNARLMREFAVGRHHRDVLFCIIGEGTSDIQRNLIARELRA
jgi:alkylation response protein AidB-like acyl-CoA dehydrogenase